MYSIENEFDLLKIPLYLPGKYHDKEVTDKLKTPLAGKQYKILFQIFCR